MRNAPRQRPTIRKRIARRGMRGGFTLLEVAIAIIVLAVGVVAVQGLVASTASVTAVSNELRNATMLAGAMHERCLGLDKAGLLALNGVSHSPPIDSQSQTLSEFPDYTQSVSVVYVDARSLTSTSATPTDLLRITVTVSRNGTELFSSARLIATTKQN